MEDFQRFLEELKSRVSIVNTVSKKVKLTRKGREFSGLCPFHNEKTPSFTVNETKNFYHCFGCGAHGDALKFEIEANRLPFIEAVEKLANEVGMKVPKMSQESKERQEKKKSLFEVMELACAFYERQLKTNAGEQSLSYLHRRGFDDAIIKRFRLGYAPRGTALKTYLLSKDVDMEDLYELGLASKPAEGRKTSYDFFRDRVMIPIMDKRGRVIAFGGRVLGDGQPKYLNSPETPLFHKGRNLYNLNIARDAAIDNKAIIVCEGYMDVIALAKYGYHHAVAPLGTALTEDQILELWRVVDEPVLCFDGDNAGKRAATRSCDRALSILKAGFSLKYAFLPDKMDPDDFLKEKGREEFNKVLEETKPLAQMLWDKNLTDMPKSTPEQKALIEKNVLDDIEKIKDERVKQYYLQDIKNKIWNELKSISWKKPSNGKKSFQKKEDVFVGVRPKPQLDKNMIRLLLANLLHYPDLLAEFEEELSAFEIGDEKYKDLYNFAIEQINEDTSLDREKINTILNENGYSDSLKEIRAEMQILVKRAPLEEAVRSSVSSQIKILQAKQLNVEIEECLKVINSSESFNDSIYNRYLLLKKEKEELLNFMNDVY